MADFAFIHNLAELALWAANGSNAKPRFQWTYTDPDSHNSLKYRVRVYKAASGGSPVYDSGEVSSVVASGAQMTHDCTQGFHLGETKGSTNIIQNGSSSDANNYVTASVTMKAGRLYLLSVENSKGSATADVISSITGGAGVPTFVSRSSVAYNSSLNRQSIWSAVPLADYTGTLTINFGGVTQTGAIWSLDEITGVDTTTTHGVVQQATGTGSSTTPLATLAAFASADNMTFGAHGHAAATATTPGSGFTEKADQTQATPAQAMATEWRTDSDTSVDFTITSAAWGACAVELQSAERWWTVEVWDSLGESSGESARTSFKVHWGQALYEFNPGTSSAWQFSNSAVAGGTQAAFLFRSATSSGGDAASGKSAFFAQIGQVPLATWLQVLVRMATQTPTTQPALPDMTFNYLGSALVPDRWTLTPGAEWALDESVRRYGSRALKCAVVSGTGGDRTAYPFRVTAGDDVPVTPNTKYTWSVFVRTNGALTGGSLRLEVWTQGGGALMANSQSVTDTTTELEADDDWLRLSVTAITGAGDTFVRPMLRYTRTSGVNETFWMDAFMQEEGAVATTWRAGGVGKAVIVDVQGIVIDGMAGGIFRIRTSNGTQIEAGTQGLEFATIAATDDVLRSRVVGDSGYRMTRQADGRERIYATAGDANPVFERTALGELGWGPGGGTTLQHRYRGGGSAFPSSPTSNDVFYRTDLDILFFYNGTRWLSAARHSYFLPVHAQAITVSTNVGYGTSPPLDGCSDIWIEDCRTAIFVGSGGTALGASHNWVGVLQKNVEDAASPTTVVTVTVNSGASAVWRDFLTTVDALQNNGTIHDSWQMVWTKTGTPGPIYTAVTFNYRLVAT